MPAEVEGLQQKQDGLPRPRVGPADFEWPQSATAKLKEKFATSLNELLHARGMTANDLSEQCYGRQAYKDGEFRPARNASLVRSWTNKKAFPTERHAGFVAQALNVSMARLLEPHGPYQKPPKISKRNGSGNGNGLAIEPHEPPPSPPPLPEGAASPIVEMATNKADPRFVDVSVKGTLPVDVAMSLFALIHPRPQ